MLEELAELGFGYVELSHGIRMPLVPGIMDAVKDGVVKVSSTHNFCPLPPGVPGAAPNLYQPSAASLPQRVQWVRQTMRSLAFGGQMGAKVLVCHMGSLGFFFTDPSARLYRLGDSLDPAVRLDDVRYKHLLQKQLTRFRRMAGRAMDRVYEAVGQVAEAALEHQIKIGVENREGFTELPLDEDQQRAVDAMASLEMVGGWHDTGHARIKEQYGFIKHASLLEATSAGLLGFHLKDVDASGDEHLAMGEGTVDFDMVRSHFRPGQILVIELGPKTKRDEVLRSRDFLYDLIAR